MSSTKEQTKKEEIIFKSVEDIRTTALSSYTAILSKTIYLFQATESQGMSLHQASSIVFDFVRNYVIYSLPLEILKDATKDMNQYKHDAYILTKETIDACNVSDREKQTLSLILKEVFYDFSAKTYNNLHLLPFIEFSKNGLSFEKSEMDNEEVLVFKTLCYPFISFFAHKYPLLESATKVELEKDIDKFLTVSINGYAQMCIYDKLVATERLSAVEGIISLLKYSLNILEKTLPKNALDFSVETLYVGYKILVEVSENKKDPELDKLLKVFEKYRRASSIQKLPRTKNILTKEPGENNEPAKGTKRKNGASTTVSRTATKGTKGRKTSKLPNSIQSVSKKKPRI